MPCPWSGFAPANLVFCERDICGWVTQPANTWTNLGFLIVGVLVMIIARREGAPRAGLLGPIAIATGLCSAAFHGTSTFVGQAMDQSSMLMESSLFIVWNLSRWRPLAARPAIAIYVALVAASVALLLVVQTAGIAIFIAHVGTFLALEARLALLSRRHTRYRALIAVGVTFAASYGLWWLDKLRVICDPDNHVFTAHGAWHLLGAVSFWFWYRHYAQFERSATTAIGAATTSACA